MRHDWIAIRQKFVEGVANEDGAVTYPTLDEVAHAHGVRPSFLRQTASRQKWVQGRNIYRAELEQETRKKRREARAKESAQFDTLTLRVAHALVVMASNDIAKASKSGAAITLNARKVIADIVEKAQRVGRLALGDATEHQQLTGPDGGPVEMITRIQREIVHVPHAKHPDA
jgi:hypothetical protein